MLKAASADEDHVIRPKNKQVRGTAACCIKSGETGKLWSDKQRVEPIKPKGSADSALQHFEEVDVDVKI